MTKRFKRVKSGLHRAEVDGQVFELQNERGHGWTLARMDSGARKGDSCISVAIGSIAVGEKELDFVLRVESYMLEIGAEHSTRYSWVLETKLGKLGISPWGRAVMCCFEDTERAQAHFGPHDPRIGGHTSKWNFHLDHLVTTERMVEFFKSHLDPILKD